MKQEDIGREKGRWEKQMNTWIQFKVNQKNLITVYNNNL